jgi:hypothetical protein
MADFTANGATFVQFQTEHNVMRGELNHLVSSAGPIGAIYIEGFESFAPRQ